MTPFDAKLASLYRHGKPVDEIAAIMGCTEEDVHQAVAELGVVRKSYHGWDTGLPMVNGNRVASTIRWRNGCNDNTFRRQSRPPIQDPKTDAEIAALRMERRGKNAG